MRSSALIFHLEGNLCDTSLNFTSESAFLKSRMNRVELTWNANKVLFCS